MPREKMSPEDYCKATVGMFNYQYFISIKMFCQAGDIWAQACDEVSSPIVHWFKIHTRTVGITNYVFIILKEIIMAFIFSGNRVASSF